MLLSIFALLGAGFGLIGDRQCGMDYRFGKRNVLLVVAQSNVNRVSIENIMAGF